jgi:serine/threonine-protein kinase RsbT
VRSRTTELGFSLVDQTKTITAASELARNSLDHGGRGLLRFEMLQETAKRGLRLVFQAQGPGIVDLDRAMTDGYTTGMGMGLGLGGAKRLVNEFEIISRLGEGTRVTITRWR